MGGWRRHSKAAGGHPFQKTIIKPKICGKSPKITPFLRLRQLKCFQMDWKSNSIPFCPVKMCNIKNNKCDLLFSDDVELNFYL